MQYLDLYVVIMPMLHKTGFAPSFLDLFALMEMCIRDRCGIVPGSILPGYYGLEAGQSAVGDIFNWFVNYIQPLGKKAGSHEALSAAAAKLAPGESGLLALDWNNGNRTVLVDQRLTGLLLGQTLYTTPAEIYRALIEATAFGCLLYTSRCV